MIQCNKLCGPNNNFINPIKYTHMQAALCASFGCADHIVPNTHVDNTWYYHCGLLHSIGNNVHRHYTH